MDEALESPSPFAGPVASVAIAGGAMLLADQLFQVAVSLGGLDLAVPAWRVRAALLLGSRLAGLVLSPLLLVLGCRLFASAAGLRAAQALIIALAVAALAAAGSIVWDGAEVVSLVAREQLDQFVGERIRALIGCLLGLIGLAVVGWASRARQAHS
jgi:hypothetical protein